MVKDFTLCAKALKRNEFSLEPLANLFRHFPQTAYCHSSVRNGS